MKVTHKHYQRSNGGNNQGQMSKRTKRRAQQRKGLLPGNATIINRSVTGQRKLELPNRQANDKINPAVSHSGPLKKMPYRELGADELLIYPDPATPFLTIEDYINFRKHGPEYMRQKFRASGVKQPKELWWLLQNCDMLLTYHRDDSELPVLQYAFAITIWIYLYAAGCVNFTGRIFTGPNTWTYGRIEDETVAGANKNDLTENQQQL